MPLSRSDLIKVIRPTLERAPHLPFIARSIVNASNASLMTANVIKDCFDDVRLHTEFSHAGSASATKVMKCVRRDPKLAI